jgi:hypothetical protein
MQIKDVKYICTNNMYYSEKYVRYICMNNMYYIGHRQQHVDTSLY